MAPKPSSLSLKVWRLDAGQLLVCVLMGHVIVGVVSRPTPEVIVPDDNSSIVIYEPRETEILRNGRCTLRTVYPVRDTLEGFLLSGAKLVEMDLTLLHYPPDFLQYNLPNLYRPHHWVRSTGRQGRSLLVLEHNYDFMSLFFLRIGVYKMNVTLADSPSRCLKHLSPKEILTVFRDELLNDFKVQKPGEEDGSLSPDEHVCNVRVKDEDGYAKFVYTCCHKSPDGDIICDDVAGDGWVDVLMTFILVAKILVVLYSPAFIPGSLYRLKYMAVEYVYRPPKPKQIRLHVTENPPKRGDNRSKKVVKLSKLRGMDKLKKMIAEKRRAMKLPFDVDVQSDKLRLAVKSRRLLGETEVPVGLVTSIYNNLVRCRIRRLRPLQHCCNRKISRDGERGIKWHSCGRVFAKFMVLCLLVLPWLLRMGVFYVFEEDDRDDQRAAADRQGLELEFEDSLTVHFTPLHLLFVLIYTVCLIDALFFGFISNRLRLKEEVKFLVQECLRDTRESSRITVCEWCTRLLVVPFDLCGFLGFLLMLPYLVFLLSVMAVFVAFYWFPALNLTFRLLLSFCFFLCPKSWNDKMEGWVDGFMMWCVERLGLHDMIQWEWELEDGTRLRLKSSNDDRVADEVDGGKPRIRELQSLSAISRVLQKEERRTLFSYVSDMRTRFIARFANIPTPPGDGQEDNNDVNGQRILLFDAVLHILAILMCLVSLWSVTLLLMEAVSFFVEVAVYTLMGLIVNADATLRYFTVMLLVAIYGHSTFSDVRKKYVSYQKQIHKILLDLKRQEIYRVAEQDEKEQDNTAFQVTRRDLAATAEEPAENRAQEDGENQQAPAEEPAPPPEPELIVKHGRPFWQTRGILMFLDNKDTPYTTEKFFYQTISFRFYGAPGPLSLSMIDACWSFSYILLFLVFVFIVVMAFGDAYRVSTTNQLLATVAGGFIPLLFRYVFTSAGSSSEFDRDSVQFRVEFENAVGRYEQIWPVSDIVGNNDGNQRRQDVFRPSSPIESAASQEDQPDSHLLRSCTREKDIVSPNIPTASGNADQICSHGENGAQMPVGLAPGHAAHLILDVS